MTYSYPGNSAGKIYAWYVVYSDGTVSTTSSTFTEEVISKPKGKR